MLRGCIWSVLGGVVLLLAACGPQEMANQPRHEPLEPTAFFADGRSSRHLVPGTVPYGQRSLAAPAYSGRQAGEPVTDLPVPLTRALLARGQERYEIYCTPCHDHVGTGRGMIVQRGYPRPPSLHIPRLRQAPIGHLFVVMTDGYGTMPPYGSLLQPPDRWAVAAYIRALQLSQYAPAATLPAEVRRHVEDGS